MDLLDITCNREVILRSLGSTCADGAELWHGF